MELGEWSERARESPEPKSETLYASQEMRKGYGLPIRSG